MRDTRPPVYYLMLLKCSDKGTSALKSTWEADLNASFTEREWSRILLNFKKMSRELKTRLIQFMILNRIYWTPSKLYKVKLIQTRECWRCHNGEGTLTHMLWSCPKIQDFWSEIHKNHSAWCAFLSEAVYPWGPVATRGPLIPMQNALMLGCKLIISEWKAPSAPVNLWQSFR